MVTFPSGVMTLSASTAEPMQPNPMPVPCVPVEMAPARVCREIEPSDESAKPCLGSS